MGTKRGTNYKLKTSRKIDHREALALLLESKNQSRDGLVGYLKTKIFEMIEKNPPEVPGLIPLEEMSGEKINHSYCGTAVSLINRGFKSSDGKYRIRYIRHKSAFILVSKENYESVLG